MLYSVFGIGIGIFVVMALYSNFALELTTHDIAYDNLDARLHGFKIMHLSDLHGRSFGSNNTKLITYIESCNPDLVVLTGDMIDGDGHNRVLFSLANALGKNYPVYYVRGNHEQRLTLRNQSALYEKLRTYGVQTLDNACVHIEHRGCKLRLSGLWSERIYRRDPSPDGHDPSYGPKDIEAAVGACDTSLFNLVMIHTPAYFDACARWGADLTFCGHMHGGMVRFPLLGGVLSPYRCFFPHYDSGLYSKGRHVLHVSRGLGNGKVGFRFLNRPELSLITLKSQGDV